MVEAPNPWADLIRTAPDEHQLIATVQRYLGTFSPSLLELLPAPCRVGQISTADEVAEWTMEIIKCEWSVDPQSAAGSIVKEMSQTLLLAYDRLKQLQGRQRPDAVL